jgi:polar amino acid transport system permease protein
MPNSGIDLVARNLPLLLDGFANTLLIAGLSIAISLVGGLAFGLARAARLKPLRALTRGVLEFFRVVPVMVLLLIGYFALPRALNASIDGMVVAVTVFSLWGSVEMGELIRGALQSLPPRQRESGLAIGLSNAQLFGLVLLPLAVRRVLPGAINLATRMVKTTSLVVLVGIVDVIKRGQQIVERTKEPFPVYAALFALFFLSCWPLSTLAARLEKRWR